MVPSRPFGRRARGDGVETVARWAGDRGRPLVVTRDEELLDEVLRLAAAGGVEVTVAADAAAAEAGWPGAPLVVVGTDRLAELVRRGLPRRMGVVVVAERGRTDDPALWPFADALHAEHVLVLPEARDWLVACFAEHGPGGGFETTARGTTVAVISGSRAAGAGELAMAFALTALGQGHATVLIGVASEQIALETVPAGPGGSLTALALERAGEAGVPVEAMAAALRMGRLEQDLVVVDLPHRLDEASLLALTAADRGHLVVVAEVRACAAAARVAAIVRRHCPALSLVVRAVRPSGLRPDEVAQALDLPLVGVIQPGLPPAQGVRGAAPDARLARLSRRLITDLDLRSRPASWARADDTGRVTG